MKTMKKILAILTAVILMLTVAAFPASAAITRGIDDSNIMYDNIKEDDSPKSVPIPVYGYVGDDAEITDDNPGDPTKPPTVNVYDINVSVPVKILWAAFQSDTGTVTAPNYYIKNHSLTNKLNVTLTDFTARTTGLNIADNAAVDSLLTLNLIGVKEDTQMNKPGIFTTGAGTINNTIAFVTEFAKNTQWNFSLSGSYTGTFTTPYYPIYDMTLKFAIAP